MASDGLNKLYSAYFGSSPKAVTMDVPRGLGSGHIAQVITKNGAALSEWSFRCEEEIYACGNISSDYVQFLFCMGEDAAWETTGSKHDFCLSNGTSCVYCGHDNDEQICYRKGGDYLFRSLRVPTGYVKALLNDYFEDGFRSIYETKLLREVSKIQITPYMEHMFGIRITCRRAGRPTAIGRS